MAEEGTSTVDPGGNSTTRPASQRTRCPPFFGLNFPKAVMPHQPNGRFAVSRCLKQVVVGPKLKVAAAQTLFGKARVLVPSWSIRAWMWFS